MSERFVIAARRERWSEILRSKHDVERYPGIVRGEFVDVAIYPDGTKRVLQEGHNIIVNNASIVLAGLVMGYQPTIVDEQIVLLAADTFVSLKHRPIVPGSVVVRNTAKTVIYKEGTDYLVDYNGGAIALIGETISPGSTVLVDYAYRWSGQLYWAVGTGNSTWDNNLPDEEATASRLVNEVYRKPIELSNISFIDLADRVVSTPTNRIQIQIVFNENEANASLREFGIFGGDATPELNTGVMLDHKIHPVISKTSNIQLARTLRFTF